MKNVIGGILVYCSFLKGICTFTPKCGHVSGCCAKYGDPAGFKVCQDLQMAGLGSTIDTYS